MDKLLHQVIKFGLAGGICFILDAGLLTLLTEIFHLHYLVSGAISFSVSTLFNYCLSIQFIFDSQKSEYKSEQKFVPFIILSIIGLGINHMTLLFFSGHLGLYYLVSKLIATAIVMIYNFISRKLLLEGKAYQHLIIRLNKSM